MKLIIIILIACSLTRLVFLAACNGNSTFGKKGNGHVLAEDRKVQPFTKLSIEGVFPIEVQQDGGTEWVKVETDENLQEYITVTNHGTELKVEMKDKPAIRKSTKMKVYVNVKDLKALNFNSVGELTTKGTLKLDGIEINTESVGKMNLGIDANFMRANLNAVGSTTLSGNVHEARINNKSVGALKAFGLKAQILMIHNTAIGIAEVYADSAFYIRSSAIGNLEYKGPGVVKELTSEGVGKVHKVE